MAASDGPCSNFCLGMCEWTDCPGWTIPSVNIVTTPTNTSHPGIDSSPPACADPSAANFSVQRFSSFPKEERYFLKEWPLPTLIRGSNGMFGHNYGDKSLHCNIRYRPHSFAMYILSYCILNRQPKLVSSKYKTRKYQWYFLVDITVKPCLLPRIQGWSRIYDSSR